MFHYSVVDSVVHSSTVHLISVVHHSFKSLLSRVEHYLISIRYIPYLYYLLLIYLPHSTQLDQNLFLPEGARQLQESLQYKLSLTP